MPAPTSGGHDPDSFAVHEDDGNVDAPEHAPAPVQSELFGNDDESEERPTDQATPPQDRVTPPQERVLPKWKVGEQVQAKYCGRGPKYSGVIKQVYKPGAGKKWVHVVCTNFVQLHKIYAFAQNLCICTKFVHCKKFVQYGMCVSGDGGVAGTQKRHGTLTMSFLKMVIKILMCWGAILSCRSQRRNPPPLPNAGSGRHHPKATPPMKRQSPK